MGFGGSVVGVGVSITSLKDATANEDQNVAIPFRAVLLPLAVIDFDKFLRRVSRIWLGRVEPV